MAFIINSHKHSNIWLAIKSHLIKVSLEETWTCNTVHPIFGVITRGGLDMFRRTWYSELVRLGQHRGKYRPAENEGGESVNYAAAIHCSSISVLFDVFRHSRMTKLSNPPLFHTRHGLRVADVLTFESVPFVITSLEFRW